MGAQPDTFGSPGPSPRDSSEKLKAAGWEAKFDVKSGKYFYVNHELKVMRSLAPVHTLN